LGRKDWIKKNLAWVAVGCPFTEGEVNPPLDDWTKATRLVIREDPVPNVLGGRGGLPIWKVNFMSHGFRANYLNLVSEDMLWNPYRYAKHLRVVNDTPDRIRLWLQCPQWQSESKQWAWTPGSPSSDVALRFELQPNQTAYLANQGQRIETPVVRLWTESEKGWRVDEHRHESLCLVDRDRFGKRRYVGPETQSHTYIVTKPTGDQIYDYRLVVVENRADRPLSVQARILSADHVWTSVSKVTVQPDEKILLRSGDGWPVQAAEARIWLEDSVDQYRWWQYRTDSLKLCEKPYRLSEGAGIYRYVARMPAHSVSE
jgi:hypothetical protein